MERRFSSAEVLDEQMVAIFRGKSPAEKVAMIAAARRTAKLLAAAGARYQHPDWSEEQVQAEAVRRISSGAG